MSEAGKMAARLPAIAWVMPNDRSRDDGSLDAMAWQEGEFSTPLCIRDAALELINGQAACSAFDKAWGTEIAPRARAAMEGK